MNIKILSEIFVEIIYKLVNIYTIDFYTIVLPYLV